MLTADFDYVLPADRIAQKPTDHRSDSRLLVLHRNPDTTASTHFQDLPKFLQAGDLLVVNNSRVIPARLFGRRPETGGRVEVLLLEPADPTGWWAMVRPGKRLRVGAGIEIVVPGRPNTTLQVAAKNSDGHTRLEFPDDIDPVRLAEQVGKMPLPPYIARPESDPEDRERYQTVYASDPGSVAAPTAGLHFTRELLADLAQRGIPHCEVTLHVGAGTFAPVKAERLQDHVMHAERFTVPAETAAQIEATRRAGGRIIAVGTTSLRVLESVARQNQGRVVPGTGRTDLFLHPPADFQVVGGLLTNFHLPRSTLLMLVSAFASPGRVTGRERVLEAYRRAIAEGFRFFSYGDAMLLV